MEDYVAAKSQELDRGEGGGFFVIAVVGKTESMGVVLGFSQGFFFPLLTGNGANGSILSWVYEIGLWLIEIYAVLFLVR